MSGRGIHRRDAESAETGSTFEDVLCVLCVSAVIAILMSSIVPIPKVPIAFRVGTMADIPFMDALQKRTSRAVGFMTRKMLEGYVEMGAVLIAEVRDHKSVVSEAEGAGGSSHRTSDLRPLTPLGYCISRDRYLKRDELGIIYQLNVAPEARRMLVGAALVREVFARSAWGCRLYCLWCARDLEANRFWEAMGFQPIAFRAGGSGKKRRGRVHIFWQRRIDEASGIGGCPRAGDEGTPYWYPYQTNQGAIREDRLVWPIPPGVHWSEVEAPDVARASGPCLPGPKGKKDTGETPVRRKRKNAVETPAPRGPGPGMVGILVGGRIKYVPRPGHVGPLPPCPAAAAAAALPVPLSSKEPRARRAKAPRAKLDPSLLTKVRELRDRWLEYVGVNGLPSAAAAPAGVLESKYHVGRPMALPAAADRKALPAAA